MPLASNFCEMGFRKIEAERWEFMNECFLMGQRDLIKSIRRRASSSSPPSLNHSQTEPCVELAQLREERHVLMMEISRLRQEEQRARGFIQAMEQRINGAEKKQRHMMSFLRRAVQNPSLLQQWIDREKELSGASLVKTEPVEHVSELEALALEMQGYRRQRIDGTVEWELDEGFWEELLTNNESSEEEDETNVK